MLRASLLTSSRRSLQRSRHVRAATTNNNVLYYSAATLIAVVGVSYCSVPLYRIFCSATGVGGTVQTSINDTFSKSNMRPVNNARRIRITFNADTSRALDWDFRPQQREVFVVPGETALAFYTAKNNSDVDVTGIATYNVVPAQAGLYFNKIQCFCFEEQKLRVGEEVDMPVFFFIDPAFAEDPNVQDIDEVMLSYTFFNAKSTKLPSILSNVVPVV